MSRCKHRWHPIAEAPEGLVAPSRLDPEGLTGPTKGQARGWRWTRSSHGRYVPFDAPRHLPEQRILEQLGRAPERAAATGWAGCRLWGAAFFDGLDRDGRTWLPVPLNVGPTGELASCATSFPLHHVLLDEDRAWRYGMPTVVPERAAYDAMRLARTRRERVVVADMIAAAQVCSLRMLRDYAATQPQHARRVLEALATASEHSRSVRESELRDILEHDAGLPRLLVNAAIHNRDGGFIGIVDLLDEAAGQAFELDGADHRTSRHQAADLRRTGQLNDVGLEVCRVVGFETSTPRAVVQRAHQSRARALFLPPAERLWVAVPPPDDLHERILAERAKRRRWGA